MPTPLELLLNPTSLIIFGLYGALLLWEAAAPARELPRVPLWRGKGAAAFITYFFVSSYLPLVWDQYLAPYQLLDLTNLGVAGGTIVGLLIYETGMWAWHRMMHRHGFLWRMFHQMHHSAERLDAYGAFYFSPLDMVGFTALASFCLVLLVGVVPQAATMVVIITTLLSIFQHCNVRTPRWLGYLVQRPESHTVHHARGVHGYNYSDLPIVDLLLGTFVNPLTYEHEVGFYQGASSRLAEMITFKDVSSPPKRSAGAVGMVSCAERSSPDLTQLVR